MADRERERGGGADKRRINLLMLTVMTVEQLENILSTNSDQLRRKTLMGNFKMKKIKF